MHKKIIMKVFTNDWNVESFAYKKKRLGSYSIPIIPRIKISPMIHTTNDKQSKIDKISPPIFQIVYECLKW